MNPEDFNKKDDDAAQLGGLATGVDTPVQQTSDSKLQKVDGKKKKRSTFPITLAFLAGAIFFALFSAGYNFYTQSERQIANQRAEDREESAVPVIPPPVDTGSISQDDLDKYVDVKNCTEQSQYAAFELAADRAHLSAIDLYDGAKVIISNGMSSKSLMVTWDTVPPVLDYKCDKIKITDITTKDRISVYLDKGTSTQMSGTVVEARILQKANK